MNYHEKLEEYINNTKYNNNNLIKLDDEKSESTIKLPNKVHKESVQFNVADDSTNYKNSNNNSKTIVIGSNTNNISHNVICDLDAYKNSANNKTTVFNNTNTSVISHHNYTTIEARKPPNFTESMSYNTRNYSTIVKDCLNFDDVSNISKYDITKYLPKKTESIKLTQYEKERIINFKNILIVNPEINNKAIEINKVCDLETKPIKNAKEATKAKDKKESKKINKQLQINSLRSLNDSNTDGKKAKKNKKQKIRDLSESSFIEENSASEEENTEAEKSRKCFNRYSSDNYSEEELKIEDLNLRKRGKKANEKHKDVCKKNASTIKKESLDDSFEIPKGFFKVNAIDQQTRRKIKKTKSRNLDKDVGYCDGTSSDSLTGETNSQSSGISFNEIKDYNANLAWHKLDFEIEFGQETNKIKDKFLNFEI